MGGEAQTEQGLVRRDIVERRRGVGDDQRILDVADVKRAGHDAEQAYRAENPRQEKRGKPFRIRP